MRSSIPFVLLVAAVHSAAAQSVSIQPSLSAGAERIAAALTGSPASAAGVPTPVQAVPAAPSRDLTNAFLALHHGVKSKSRLGSLEKAQSYRYLLVPGFLGNHIEDYLGETKKRLSALGLDARILSIDTDGDGAGNLLKIGRAVEESPTPVVLIGHSRGGMHSHDWYRAASPALKAKVVKLALVQAPLQGSPIADIKIDGRFAQIKRWKVAKISTWLGWGDVPGALEELTSRRRAAVMASLPPLTADDLAKTYTVTTTFDPVREPLKAWRYHRDMKPLWLIIKAATGEKSDGLVAESSSKVPGARSIQLDDLDHEDTVLQNPAGLKKTGGSAPHPGFHVGDVTEALVRTLLLP
ncbi:MAG: alpha/beta fold hydrolase [Elusimicrobia bacterium]|nr:alpha/beta fold hydrolase [Elusimicrobiota bacterium]